MRPDKHKQITSRRYQSKHKAAGDTASSDVAQARREKARGTRGRGRGGRGGGVARSGGGGEESRAEVGTAGGTGNIEGEGG